MAVKAKPKAESESKQGLIITLVFFVLLSIGLGVGTYYGFADQKRLQEAAAAAKKSEDAKTKSRDWEQYKYLTLKVYSGHGADDDAAKLVEKRKEFDSGTLGKDETDREKFAAILKRLDDKADGSGPRWDPVQNKMSTFAELVTNLKADRAAMQKRLAQADDEMNKAKAQATATLDATTKSLAETKQKLKEREESVAKIQADKSAEFVLLETKFQKLGEEKGDVEKKSKEAEEKSTKEIQTLTEFIAKLNKDYKSLKGEGTSVNLVEYDTPKGKIIDLARNGAYAYINLGSADSVNPHLTFSIFGSDQGGKRGRERKGALEVINVVNAHTSMAQITEVQNANREPILIGDYLFNPSWNARQKDHIAIAGLIDLTGDGRDASEEFMRALKRQGTEIDAYLDMKDYTVKGEMTRQTSFLVLGEKPEVDSASAVTGATSKKTETRTGIGVAIGEMEATANKLGITVLSARRYMALIGYRVPRSVAVPDYNLRTRIPEPREAPKEKEPRKDAADADAPKDTGEPKPAKKPEPAKDTAEKKPAKEPQPPKESGPAKPPKPAVDKNAPKDAPKDTPK